MIQVQGGNLVLTPRALTRDTKEIVAPLLRAYECPNCNTLFYGAFQVGAEAKPVNMHPYASNSEHTLLVPTYKWQLVRVPGMTAQFFWDENHCGEGKLPEVLKDSGGARCKFIKFYYELNYHRILNRLVKDMSCMDLYGAHMNGKFYGTHADMLKACVEALENRTDSVRRFLARHPYGRFVPDLLGTGPAGYIVMYRYEAGVLHNFYREVIERRHECLYDTENVLA